MWKHSYLCNKFIIVILLYFEKHSLLVIVNSPNKMEDAFQFEYVDNYEWPLNNIVQNNYLHYWWSSEIYTLFVFNMIWNIFCFWFFTPFYSSAFVMGCNDSAITFTVTSKCRCIMYNDIKHTKFFFPMIMIFMHPLPLSAVPCKTLLFIWRTKACQTSYPKCGPYIIINAGR